MDAIQVHQGETFDMFGVLDRVFTSGTMMTKMQTKVPLIRGSMTKKGAIARCPGLNMMEWIDLMGEIDTVLAKRHSMEAVHATISGNVDVLYVTSMARKRTF